MPTALRLVGGALLLLAAGCRTVLQPAVARPDGPIIWNAFDGPRLAYAVAAEANRVRAEQGVSPLYYAPEVVPAADEQAAQLVLMNNADHTNLVPGQETAAARVRRLGVDPAAVAEHALMEPIDPAGVTYGDFARQLVQAWMDSPGHRANLLNPLFTHTGCAARLGHTPRPGHDRVYAVQVFLLPATRSATVRTLTHP